MRTIILAYKLLVHEETSEFIMNTLFNYPSCRAGQVPLPHLPLSLRIICLFYSQSRKTPSAYLSRSPLHLTFPVSMPSLPSLALHSRRGPTELHSRSLIHCLVRKGRSNFSIFPPNPSHCLFFFAAIVCRTRLHGPSTERISILSNYQVKKMFLLKGL